MLPFSDHYLDVKNLRYQLLLSTDIDDQRTLQSDWTRGTTNHTKTKVVVSDASFLWWLSPCKKFKSLVDFFKMILMIRLWLKHQIFPRLGSFCRIIRNTVMHQFYVKKDINRSNVWQKLKTLFSRNFWAFYHKWEFFCKIWFRQFLTL